MQERQNVLINWLSDIFPNQVHQLQPVAGDASFRRYYRIEHSKKTYIIMDAPPTKEAVKPFVSLSQELREIGVNVPKIYACNEDKGFVLLEDFGDQLFINAMQPCHDKLYFAAMQIIYKFQAPKASLWSVPCFDKASILKELHLFQHWFLEKLLDLSLNNAEKSLLKTTFDWLANELLTQPQTFNHADFHSRNLMLLSYDENPKLGVIDFQDGMIAPITYDLVSLLKDCYIEWPDAQIQQWVSFFYHHLPQKFGWSEKDFSRGFELSGIQRHLKVLGIFSRLHLRDNKSSYLKDIPLVIKYLSKSIPQFAPLKPFNTLIAKHAFSRFNEKVSL